MNTKFDIAVIIPVYNTAKYLTECINSLPATSTPSLEIILVDDGSTDKISPAMCDEYANNDSRIKVIHKENGGLQSAWIRGVRESNADYLCFLDSDDWIDSQMFDQLYSHTSSNFRDCEIISSGYVIEKRNERKTVIQPLQDGEYTDADISDVTSDYTNFPIDRDSHINSSSGNNTLSSIKEKLLGEEPRPVILSRCMKLISRKLIEYNLHYCDSRLWLGEDVNIIVPALCDCKRLYIDNTPYYHYRTVSGSMVHSHNKDMLGNIHLLCELTNHILKEKHIATADFQTDREYIRMLFLLLKNELRNKERGASQNIKSLFSSNEIKKKVQNTTLDVSGLSNKLLYTCMRHPSSLMIAITRFILRTYDRRTN